MVQIFLERLQEGQHEYKQKILKGSVVPRDLKRKENLSQETYHSQNLRYETLKSPLLKKTNRFSPTSFLVKAILHSMHVFVSFTPHRMNEYITELDVFGGLERAIALFPADTF